MENRTCGYITYMVPGYHGITEVRTDEIERDERASRGILYRVQCMLQAELTMLAFKNQVGEGSKFARDPHLRSILPWVCF